MNTFRTWVKQHSFAIFLVLTFALSWWPSPFNIEDLPILPLGPMLAALIVVPLADGWTGLKNLFRTSFRWRIGLRWYVVAITFPIVLSAVAAGVNILLGAPASMASWPTSIAAYLSGVVEFFIFVALGEEIGFSAFALPRLLRRYSILATVVILGLTRVLWHLPLFLVGETQWPVAVLLFPTQLIFTWIFIRSRGSAFPLILAHLSIGTVGTTFFTSLFTGPDLARMVWLQAAAFVIAGLILLLTSRLIRSALFAPDDPAVAGEVQAVAIP